MTQVQQTRQLSDKAFNLNDIIKANAKHKPGKSIGTATKKQLNKTVTKPKKTSEEEANKTGTAKAKKTNTEDDKGTNVKKKTASKSKKETSDISETEKVEAGSEAEQSELSPVPAHLKTVLEIPLIVGSDLDMDRLAEFKEFVEDLELKYLPSVSTIISATQSPEQVKVLERWQARMTKELGGEEQFKQYKQGTVKIRTPKPFAVVIRKF